MTYVCSLNSNNAALIAGKSVLNSLEELYVAIKDSEARLIEIEDDFAEKFFTSRALDIFIKEAKKINRFVEIKVSQTKLPSIERSLLKLKSMKTKEEFVSYILQDNEAIPLIHSLCTSYDGEQTEALKASAKLNTMNLEHAALIRNLDQSKANYAILQELHEIAITKLDTLVSRINYKYGKDVDEAKMLGFEVDYRKYHKVLYVKEITRITYTDTLLYYLQEILRTLYGVPTRFVVIEPPYAYERSYLYKRCVPHIKLSYEDVYKSDIFMAGYQANLMEDIMRNPSNIKFLIILDRSGWAKPYVTGDGVECIYTASDINDIKGSLPLTRVLSYNKETLNIPFIKNFDKLSMEQQIGKYSSMPSMQAIIELMERGD